MSNLDAHYRPNGVSTASIGATLIKRASLIAEGIRTVHVAGHSKRLHRGFQAWIKERLGHALSGSLTLDVYTHAEWPENVEAAKLAGEQIEKAVISVSPTANQEKGPLIGASEALAAQQFKWLRGTATYSKFHQFPFDLKSIEPHSPSVQQ